MTKEISKTDSPERETIYREEIRRGKDLIIENRVRRSGEYYYTQDIIRSL